MHTLHCPIALSYPSSSFPPPLQERKSPRSLSSYALTPTPFATCADVRSYIEVTVWPHPKVNQERLGQSTPVKTSGSEDSLGLRNITHVTHITWKHLVRDFLFLHSQSRPSPRLTAFGTKSSLVKKGCPVYLRTSVSCVYSSTSTSCAGIQVFFGRPVWFTLKGSVDFVLVNPPHFSLLWEAVRGKSVTREKEAEGLPLRQGAHPGRPSGTGPFHHS
jgi:hypothetical protein